MFEAIFDLCTAGIMILDRSGVLYKNPALVQMAGDGFSLTRTGLALQQREEDAAFQPLLERFLSKSTAAGEHRSLLMTRPTGKRPYAVVLRRVKAKEGAGSRGCVVVSVNDLSQVDQARVQLITDLYGLLPSEEKLLRALIETRDLTKAAKACGVTAGSARQYLKRIFQKTNTTGQLELFALVFAGVPI